MLSIVVFDTNILISATLSQRSSPYRCLQLAKDGLIQLLMIEDSLM
jgi:predicted nucleic acid-binding protein